MRYILSVLIFISTANISVAQYADSDRKKDSLVALIKAAKEDTTKSRSLLRLAYIYQYKQPDSAHYFMLQAKALDEKLKYYDGLFVCLAFEAELLGDAGKYQEALDLDLRSFDIAKRSTAHYPDWGIKGLYNQIGNNYSRMSNYDSSTYYWLKALDISEKNNEAKSVMAIEANLVTSYLATKQFDKAYTYGVKAVDLARNSPESSPGKLAYALNSMSLVLIKQKKYDSATKLLQEQLDISKKVDDMSIRQAALSNLCDIYLQTGQYSLVPASAKEQLDIARHLEDADGEAIALNDFSRYYLAQKDYVQAASYAQQAVDLALKNKMNEHAEASYLLLSYAAIGRGDMASSDRYKALSDSIQQVALSDKILKNSQEMDTRYEVTKKDQEIKLQKATLSNNRLWITILTSLIVFSLSLFFVARRSYKNKQKLSLQEKKLQQQKIVQLENEKQLSATQAIVQGQEEERTRLAQDLHDGLGGILSSTKYSLGNMKQNLVVTPENATAFERTMAMLDQSISELRRVAHNMMPETLMKLSLSEALQDYCAQVTQSGALNVTYQSFGMEHIQLENAVKITVYRVVQELVNNSIKHANAKTATVQLMNSGDKLNITVEDDGVGFDKNILAVAGGIGYKNLQSRIDFLKGTIDIQSAPGKSTSVYIEIPIAS